MSRRGPGSGRPDPPDRRTTDPRGNLAALRARLTEVIEPVTDRAGLELDRVAVSRVGRRHSVRVVVDGDDAGLDKIAEVSRALSSALDAADQAGTAVVPGEYVLEVSSPGVDRPLTEPRHWRRNVGRLVAVTVAEQVPGPDLGDGPAPEKPGRRGGRQLTGRIIEARATGVVLEVDGQQRRLPHERLGPGRVQVELRRLESVGDGDHGDGDHGDQGGDQT